MAAPADKTLRNLNGQWTVNYELSESTGPALAIQGIGYVIRTAISYATITLTVTQYEAAPKPPNTSTDTFTHIDITQSASGLTSTQENRCVDDMVREHTDWLFGTVQGRTKWVSLEDVEDTYLKNGWLVEGDGKFLCSHVENQESGWTADQVWGFQSVNGERHYCRNIVVAKGKQRAEFRLVYNYDDV
ncbi:hypothetical protein E4U52_005654 [Claviceps spartinae]|nr:hypothetical protein E4U52_005654 [Claviceps spartinae]KAG6083102.1 hypothetical protein E4U15_002154 [Claviceps sp. LM218 group G6]KAG6093747.1 hypothetical protein E4U30_004053 [Claviceps sp. LM220 group G6]KAG6104722.1 hypothetical protein E4U31_001840 [Claviceps sp. LM219 group G6]KAG6116306.1 hypothetical protein E4U14_000309 [Claviceps sp. LM454 group G7]